MAVITATVHMPMLRRLLAFGLAVLIGWLTVDQNATLQTNLSSAIQNWWFIVLAIPVLWVIWFVVTLLHELGHLIFAWIAQLEVQEFQAGFLWFKSNANHWSFTFTKPELSGWVILEPDDGTRHWRKKVAFCTAGGPFANLLIVASSLPTTAMPMLGLSLVGFGFLLISAMQLVLSLYPQRSNRGFLSDGANLLAFLRGQPMTN